MTAEVLGPVDIRDPFRHLRWDASGSDAFVLMTTQERMQLALQEGDKNRGVTQEEYPRTFPKIQRRGRFRITNLVDVKTGCIAVGVAVATFAIVAAAGVKKR